MAAHTKTTYTCDRCGGEVLKKPTIRHDALWGTLKGKTHYMAISIRGDAGGGSSDIELQDLCRDCCKSFNDWLKEGSDQENEE